MNNKNVKSYNCQILTNDRKKGFLDETFKALNFGSKVCLDLGMALLGGIDMNLAIEMAKDKKEDVQEAEEKNTKASKKTNKTEEKKAVISAELILAACLFRIVPKSNNEVVVAAALPSLFERYSGTQINEQVKEYFSSNFNSEKYMWKDMRCEFQKLASELNVSEKDLFSDVATMVEAKFIGLKFGEIWGIVSNLFGTGDKVPKDPKINLVSDCIARIRESNPETEDELSKIFLECSNCEDAQSMYLKYFISGRKPSEYFYANKIGSSAKIDQKKVISKLNKNLKKYKIVLDWKCNNQIKSYLANKIFAFNQKAWSEIFNASWPIIQSKTTRNLNFVLEQLQDKAQIDYSHEKFYNKVNQFFESSYFKTDNKFIIKSKHVGGEDLYNLWQDWDSWEENKIEKNLEKFSESIEDNSSKPDLMLLKYIHSIRKEISCDQVLNGIRFGQQKFKIENRFLNPIVDNSYSYNWGDKSKLNGCIISPDKKSKFNLKNNRPDYDYGIWMELEVLNNGNWEKHHFLVSNTRFMEEVYCFPKSGAKPIVCLPNGFRTKRNGFDNNVVLSDQQIQNIRNAPKHRRRAIKRQMRLEALREQNKLPLFNWNNDYNINISKSNNGYRAIISKKFEIEICKDVKVVLGVDQNQSANHTYAAFLLCDKNEEGAIAYCGQFVRPIESGFVVSKQAVGKNENKREFDQLSYNGIKWGEFNDLHEHRKNFLEQWGNVFKVNKFGVKSNVSLKDSLIALEKNNPVLYYYNMKYLNFLKNILYKKSKIDLFKIREEIFETIRDGKFSVMKLSSLSGLSFSMIRSAKSLISSYFGNLLEGTTTDDQKYESDPEMFELRQKLEKKRKDKQKSKKELTANKIVSKAIELQKKYGTVLIVLEDIGNMTSNSNKNSVNSASMDWLARGVANKVKQLSKMHEGILYYSINPFMTSHQMPLVHNNPDRAFKARFGACEPKYLFEKDFKAIKKFSKECKDTRQTTVYYRQAMKDFMEHYDISEEDMSKIDFLSFKSMMSYKLRQREEVEMLYPKMGGRVYLSTHQLDDSEQMLFNGVKYWKSNADIIAAFNIALAKIGKNETSSDAKTP